MSNNTAQNALLIVAVMLLLVLLIAGLGFWSTIDHEGFRLLAIVASGLSVVLILGVKLLSPPPTQ